ncbi:LuxR C-terminal-related transcriptional regulator [Streptomyces sp. NPDC056401]|uniref:LuxR C-terminal-related transcriptional regulator n=1 Tax=Streptomyces sp. NPDC056401 TaxID=3345809 RepID=UPI0035E023D5
MLDVGIQGPLTCVVGPPGTGKSALLTTWRGSREALPGRRAWLTFSEEDNDPASLGAHLVASLRGSGAAELLRLDDPMAPELLAPTLVNAIARLTEPLLLVLDDFHALRPGPARGAVLQMIRHAPAPLSVVIASRREPEIALHRLRAAGRVTEIRHAELAFTRTEADTLFTRAGLTLDPASLTSVLDCSGGWPVALQCVVNAREECENWRTCLEVRARAGQLCSEFLLRELLDQLPADDLDLLLRTSVCEVLEPSLVRALTGRADAGRALRRLAAERDLLISEGVSTYRHHPSLRRVLTRELGERSTSDEMSALSLAAYEWHRSRKREGGAEGPPAATACATTPRPTVTVTAGQGPVRPTTEQLTDCELEVLRLLPTQQTLEEIAAARCVSVNTVKSQVRVIYRKFGVAKRREAVALAQRIGLLR